MTAAERDRRAVPHLAPAGAPNAGLLAHRPTAVVVGGGIAGIAAAVGLAERGVSVTLLERQPYLGGRAAAWPEDGVAGPRSAGRGFHAFFRQYYNLRALIRRADPELTRLVPVDDYPLVDALGRRDSFRGLPRTPPWNAIAFALRSPTFRVRDLFALEARAAAPLAAVSVPDTYTLLDGVDAATFLRRVAFPPVARHLAFEIFSRSFFTPPEHMSAAELAVMFHIYFLGSSEGLVFDVPDAAYDTSLWQPLCDHLIDHRVTVRTGVEVTAVSHDGHLFRLRDVNGERWAADGVVLATDVSGLRDVVASSPDLADPDWTARVAALRTAPPFLVWRLWLDRPVRSDRPAFLATGGMRPLDNVSVLDRYERQARDWAARYGGSVVELHAYAVGTTVTDTKRDLAHRLHALYPETAAAGVVADSVQWHADCPRFGVGDFARRPKVRTPFPGLVLAGDGIRIDLPVALMERAATTGWHAANCLLARWGLSGHKLYSVPTKGRLAPLRLLAIRGGR